MTQESSALSRIYRFFKRCKHAEWTLPAVFCGSGIWLIVAAILFAIFEPCSEVASGFWARKITCLSPNEMGDFLAGVFAPLAFLWLIAAVFLQKRELEAQRQELRESRNVANQHVREARKNVEFIKKQTKILDDQNKQARRDHIDQQFDRFVSLLETHFNSLRGHCIARFNGTPPHCEFRPISFDMTPSPSSQDTEYIQHCIGIFRSRLTTFQSARTSEQTRLHAQGDKTQLKIGLLLSGDIDDLAYLASTIRELIAQASEHKRFEIRHVDLDVLLESIEELKEISGSGGFTN